MANAKLLWLGRDNKLDLARASDRVVNLTLDCSSTNHAGLSTLADAGTLRFNSRNYTQTSGDSIGFQSKPAQTVSSSGSVFGAQISPRLNSAVALTGSGSIIGLHVDTYLKGTAGDVAGEVRGLQVELVDDNSAGRTVTGDIVGIRFRSNLSCANTGDQVALKVENGEGALKWDAFAKLEEETGKFAKHTAAGVALPADVGYIRVKVGDTFYKMALYND